MVLSADDALSLGLTKAANGDLIGRFMTWRIAVRLSERPTGELKSLVESITSTTREFLAEICSGSKKRTLAETRKSLNGTIVR